jgi:hypothetical protein
MAAAAAAEEVTMAISAAVLESRMKRWSSHDMAVEEGRRMSDDDRQWKR